MFEFLSKIIDWFEKHPEISWAITIILALFIFYISSQPFEKGVPGPEFPLKSYLYHIAIFFLFAFFLSLSIIKGDSKKGILIFVAILTALAYGIFDEIHQFLVPNRSCNFQDVLTDSFGVICGVFFYTINLMDKKRKNKPLA